MSNKLKYKIKKQKINLNDWKDAIKSDFQGKVDAYIYPAHPEIKNGQIFKL
jgi:hypothetical protein